MSINTVRWRDEALDLALDEAEGHGAGPLGLETELEGELVSRSRRD